MRVGSGAVSGSKAMAALVASMALASCSGPGLPAFKIEIDSARFAFDGSTGQWDAFHGGGHRTLWISPDRTRIREVIVEPEMTAAGVRERRSVETRLVLHDRGEIWSSATGGASWERTALAVEAYELENERRRRLVDALIQVVEDPELAANPAATDFLASGESTVERVQDRRYPWRDRLQVRAEVDPGLVWTIVVGVDVGAGWPLELRERLMASVMRWTHERSRALAERLGGFPLRFEAADLPEPGGAPSLAAIEIGSVDRMLSDASLFAPSPPAFDLVPDLDALAASDPLFWLAWIETPGDRPEPISELELLIRFGSPASASVCERLARVWSTRQEYGERVDLMRAVVRAAPERALEILGAGLASADSSRVLPAIEALVAESHPASARALADVLRGAIVVADLEPGVAELWAMRELRAVAGVPVADILAASADADEGRPRLEAEFDFWIRRFATVAE